MIRRPRAIRLLVSCTGLLLLSCGGASEERTEDISPASELSAHAWDGKGTAVVIPAGPVRASSWGSWRILFFPGEEGIAKGGGIVFQVSPFWGWSRPQTVAPDAAGYTTVVTTNEDIGFELVEGDPHHLLIVLARGNLTSRDTVTITYGDTLTGAAPQALARADRYAEKAEDFLLKVDGNGDSFFTPIESSPAIDIIARDAATLVAYAPSIVTPGQEFLFHVSALDESANRDTGFRGTVEIGSPGGGLDLPDRHVFSAEEKGSARISAVAKEAGVHSIEVRTSDARMRAVSNPILCVTEKPQYELFWGDLHGHSGLSDGTGQPDEFYSYARDVAGLGACALTDHDAHGALPIDENPALWDLIRETTQAFYEPRKFVTFLGYEWTSWTYGHRHVLYPGTEGMIYSFRDSTSDTPEELYSLVKSSGGIVIPHHPGGGPIPIDWNHHDDAGESLVEICSVHGNSDHYGCPGQIYRPEQGSFVQDALARGFRLGILASGDTHDGHPGLRGPDYPSMGLAGIWAKELTREGVLEALGAKRLYGTSGARIILEFTVDGHRMGETMPLSETREGEILVKVLGTAAVDLLEILENDAVIRSEEPGSSRVELLHRHRLRPGAYYRVRLVQSDGEMAWSSPVWCGGR